MATDDTVATNGHTEGEKTTRSKVFFDVSIGGDKGNFVYSIYEIIM